MVACVTVMQIVEGERGGEDDGCAPPEGVEEDEDFKLSEVFGEGDHAEGVQAQAQRVALHALVVPRQVPQIRRKRLRTHPPIKTKVTPALVLLRS